MVASASKILVMMIMILVTIILEANEDYFNDSITSDWAFPGENFEPEIPPDLIAAIENNVSPYFLRDFKNC